MRLKQVANQSAFIKNERFLQHLSLTAASKCKKWLLHVLKSLQTICILRFQKCIIKTQPCANNTSLRWNKTQTHTHSISLSHTHTHTSTHMKLVSSHSDVRDGVVKLQLMSQAMVAFKNWFKHQCVLTKSCSSACVPALVRVNRSSTAEVRATSEVKRQENTEWRERKLTYSCAPEVKRTIYRKVGIATVHWNPVQTMGTSP